MSFLLPVKQFSQQRHAWLLLFICIIIFEACALFFQHVLILAPCVMCVYERVAMMGVAGAALIGFINPKSLLLRYAGLATWAYTAFRGFELAREHVGYQFNPSPFATCDIFPQFPSWAPLNQWAPWMFEPTGDCSKIVWQFLSLSMPEWLVIIFAGNLIAVAIIIISQFARQKA